MSASHSLFSLSFVQLTIVIAYVIMQLVLNRANGGRLEEEENSIETRVTLGLCTV